MASHRRIMGSGRAAFGVLALSALAVPALASAAVCTASDRSRGYDVVLLAGQSNMVGFGSGFDAALDGTPDPRIRQWSQAGTAPGVIVAAIDPLLHPGLAAGRVGLGLGFARAYLAMRRPRRSVLLVPAAVGGTGFADGRWNPGDDLFEGAVRRTRAALAAAPNGCLAAILWHQGESDVGALTGPEYAARLARTVAAFRRRIGGAARVPFVTGRFEPEWVKPTPAQTAILDALAHLGDTVPGTVNVSADGLTGNPDDKIHFDAASQRTLGRRYFEGLQTVISKVYRPARFPLPSAGEGGPRAKSGEGSDASGYGAPLSRPSLTRGPPSPAEGGGIRRGRAKIQVE